MIPLFIPSYKNRRNLNKILVTNRDVYIFVWDFDFSNYKDYSFPSNYKIIQLKVPEGKTRCIQTKRRLIQRFAFESGIESFYFFDDDVSNNCAIDIEPRYNTKSVALEQFLEEVDKRLDKNSGIIGFNLSFFWCVKT